VFEKAEGLEEVKEEESRPSEANILEGKIK